MRIAAREAPRLLRQVQQRGDHIQRPGSGDLHGGSAGTHHPSAPSSAGGTPRPQHGSTTRADAPQGRHLDYAPDPDGNADPGEVVWTWVQYEEDATQGKDRPVLVVGREGSVVLGLMLSSQHARDGQDGWFALGSGPWDRAGRPSWLRLDRVLEVPEAGIRREGAVLDRERFDRVADALRSSYGWV